MRLYPTSLLITAAVLLPNLLYVVRPPANVLKYGKPAASLPLTILERVGQAGSFVLPVFYPLSFSGTWVCLAWTGLGTLLAAYYLLWIRFFVGGRDYAALFRPILGVPVPMAVSPVLYFLLSSVVLGSFWQTVAAAVLGIGHVTVTFRESSRVSARSSGAAGA